MPEPQDCKSLDEVRSEIDRLDFSLITTICRRQEFVYAASRFKSTEEEVHAQDRQREMLTARRQWAETEGVDPDLIEALFRTMVDHFIGAEMAMFSAGKSAETGAQSPSIMTEAVASERSERADA